MQKTLGPEGPGFRPNSRSESKSAVIKKYIWPFVFKIKLFINRVSSIFVQNADKEKDKDKENANVPESDTFLVQTSQSESSVGRRRTASFKHPDKKNKDQESEVDMNKELTSSFPSTSTAIPIK